MSKEPFDKDTDTTKMFHITERFATLNRLVMRDLNSTYRTPSFSLYSKDDITTYIQNPYQYRNELRAAVVYIYGASSHFRRLIQYFAGLSDLAYVISPYKIETSRAKLTTIANNYRKTADLMSNMSVKTQFPKILTVCLREDTFYGTFWETKDSITIQQLPSDYCDISAIEGNVFNVTFDFSYFDTNSQYLELYPVEFKTKYNAYLKDRVTMRWQELSSPNSFAIKCNKDLPDYAMPPFIGVLRDVYDLEDYRNLKLTKTALENYAMLVMKLGINDDGEWLMDFEKAKEFWRNLDSVLPEEVGSVLSPMEIQKISFEKVHAGEGDSIAEAEQNLFTAAGVSSLLFNNEKASANALMLSIKADQAITFDIVKSIEEAVNRFLQAHTFGRNFKVTFLDCSPYNRKEVGDMYLKACQYGMPMVSYYAASQGLAQNELDAMNFLENEVLNIKRTFIPLSSSNTQSSTAGSADTTETSDEGGRPTKDAEDLTESGEQNQEDA